MSKIYINRITLSNIACFDTYQAELGKITRVLGKNGTGKTSLINGLSAGMNAGNPVEIIRKGSEKGEIAIEFSNGMVLKKVIDKDGKARVVVKDENGSSIQKPQSFINQLVDSYSFNPVSILLASPKERIKLLLEAIPLKASKEDFRTIFHSLVDSPEFESLLDQHALDAIEEAYKKLYENRSSINSQLKKSVSTIENLSRSLPESSGEDVEEKITELIAYIKDRSAETDQGIGKVLQEKDLKLLKLQEEYQAKRDRLDEWLSNEKSSIIGGYESAVKIIHSANDPFIKGAETELIRLQEARKHQAVYENQRRLIETEESEAKNLKSKSEMLSEGLKKLEQLKSKFLSNIPIQGLNVENGIIYYDGIEFDNLNSQKQIEIACEIAKLRSGELGFVFVDGFERLDTEHQGAFINEFSKTDLQLLVTEVSDDSELTVVS